MKPKETTIFQVSLKFEHAWVMLHVYELTNYTTLKYS